MENEINLALAIQYISEHGTILEQARLLRILVNAEPTPEAYKKLIESQNPDGGFPSRPRSESASALDSTLTALWQFDELGLLDSPSARRAFDFLRAMQRPDGGWDENPALPEHDLPPWIRPGEMGTRLYLSTYAAFWLPLEPAAAAPSSADDHTPFERALGFIAAHQAADGSIPGFLHNNWLGAAAFLGGGAPYAENAARALAYLSVRPLAEWDDSQVAWALEALARAGLPAGHPLVQAGLAALAARQSPEGCWAAEDGPAFAASATVGVLKVFNRHGLLPGLD